MKWGEWVELGQASARFRILSFPKNTGEPLKGFKEGGDMIDLCSKKLVVAAVQSIQEGKGDRGKAS